MRRLAIACVIVTAALVPIGCGGSNDDTHSIATTRTSTSVDPAAAIDRAARRAVEENFRLSQHVGWPRRVPAWATRSTGGAALEEMRISARENAQEGVRIRHLSSDLRIRTIRVDPSYERATATVSAKQRIRIHRQGRRRPVVRATTERVRIELRRIGDDDPARFVVWKVRVL